MVQRIVKLAEKAVGKAKDILFMDPKLLYENIHEESNNCGYDSSQNQEHDFLFHTALMNELLIQSLNEIAKDL